MLSLNVVRDPHRIAGIAGFGTLFLVVPLVASRTTTILIADAVFIVVTAVATLLCARVGAAHGAARTTWLSAAAGCAFWLAAQAFMVPEHLGLTDNDLLELGADVTSMLVVPALVTGLMLLAHSGQSRRVRREMALDATLAIIATTAVGYEAVAGPIRQGAGNDRVMLGATIAWQAFALAGFFVLTAGLIWRAGSLARPVARPLLGGFITLIGGVVCYIVGVIVSDYYPGSPIDAPFLAGFLLLIVAASRAYRVPDLQPAPLGQDYLRWRTGLVISSILAVGGMATYAASAPGRDPLIAALLVVATFVLVARVAIGASDHLRLDRRTVERDRLAAVLDLSAAVSGSLDPDLVLGTLALAGARAAGRSHGRAVLLSGDGAVEAIADAGRPVTGRPREVDLIDARLVSAGAALGARNVHWATDPAVPADLSRKSVAVGIRTSAVAPLVALGERLGYVEAWTPGTLVDATPADLAALAAIGQQGGLAMRNARLHAELERRAGTDELTGLLNRRALFAELERLLDEARAAGGQVGVLLIDVDGFKACNDTYGHVSGDRLLRELASILGVAVRETDLAGRYGGDEFIVVLPGADATVTRRVAERIREQARRVALVADGANLRLRVSIGTASTRESGYVADELIGAADRAMYAAKAAQRTPGWDVATAR